MKKSILFIHLLNDYSGSPRVLQSVINSAIHNGDEVRVLTSSGEGFLSHILGASYSYVPYTFFKNKLIALINYIIWQFVVFCKVLFMPHRFQIIYINTMHPFGAAIAAMVRGNKIIYHIHETSIKPALLKKWLRWVIRMAADEIIYVSAYLKDSENIEGKKTHVIYNALSHDFQQIPFQEHRKKNTFEVLMLCSLKKYKGVDEFVDFANCLPEIHFRLVLNTSSEEIDYYFKGISIPSNLSLHSSTRDVHSFYRNADLVMNLSHRGAWIETFGMTIAEAFSYGIPVIVPEVGGIAELVNQDENGYKLNHDKTDEICLAISTLAGNYDRHMRMRRHAYQYAARFNIQAFYREIVSVIHS